MADVTLDSRPTAGAQPLAVACGDWLPAFAGNWTAHLEFADLVPAPTGKVTVRWQGRDLVGAVLRSGQSSAGRTFALVAGGNGHLAQAIPPKLPSLPYRNATAQIIASQLLTAAGETLSPTSDAGILATRLAFWPRRNDTAAALLDDLARKLGCIWRVLPDGSVYLGRDTYADAGLTQPLQALDEQDPAHATALYVPHALGPLPGQSYEGRKVGAAHYSIDPDGAFLRLWFHDAAETDVDSGSIRYSLARIIRETLRVDFLKSYTGKVVVQRPDGTLDIQLDLRDIPPLPAVRYRVVPAGAKLTVPAGSRVVVTFDNGDPLTPVAGLFDPGMATRGVARLNDTVKHSPGFQTWTSLVKAALTALGADPALAAIVNPTVITALQAVTAATDPIGLISSASGDIAIP